MAITCGAKCAKGALLTYNLVFWLSGCAILGLGIFLLVEDDRSTLFKLFKVDETHALIHFLAYGCIGVGGLVFIFGFFGCCGAIQENKCMVITYFVFLLVVLLAELAVGVLAVLFQDKMYGQLERTLADSLNKTYGSDTEFTRAVDLAQAKFDCCGAKGAEDYEWSVWKARWAKGDSVPKSCCLLTNKGDPRYFVEPKPANNTLCQRNDLHHTENYRHQASCLYKLESFVKSESLLLIAAGCGLAALEIFGMIFAICLCKTM